MIDAAPLRTALPGSSGNLGQPHLEVQGLSCARGGRLLFAALDFSAGPGAAIEVRGPNGVGKTTLLRALAGLVRPLTGDVRLRLGAVEAVNGAACGQFMHFAGPEPAARPEETVRQSLTHWALVWGAPKTAADEAIARLGLTRAADRAARRLSSGERRRLTLARLLLQERPVWLLDEPNTGLDAAGRALCHQLITGHRTRGGVVIAATHDAANLEDAAMIRLGAHTGGAGL